jgi:hypothetical protein
MFWLAYVRRTGPKWLGADGQVLGADGRIAAILQTRLRVGNKRFNRHGVSRVRLNEARAAAHAGADEK